MNGPTHNYHNDAFSLNQAGDYTLLLQISAASFSYSVVFNNRLLLWETGHPIAELLNPGDLKDILSAPYKQVIIGLPATGFTLIPEALYNDEQLHNFARFLNVQAGERVFVQQLDTENRVIYKVKEQAVEAASAFGLAHTVFAGKGWVKAIGNNIEDAVYADIQGNTVSFLYFSYGKLRYLNNFEFYNEDELAYYATFICDQLKLQPKRTRLLLSSDISNDDRYTSSLTQFFSKVELLQLQVIDLPAEVEPQHILSLSALILCG